MNVLSGQPWSPATLVTITFPNGPTNMTTSHSPALRFFQFLLTIGPHKTHVMSMDVAWSRNHSHANVQSTLTFLQITLSLEKIPQKFISIIYSGFVVFETKVGSSLGHLQCTKAVLDLSTCNVNRAILRTCNLTFSFNFSFK